MSAADNIALGLTPPSTFAERARRPDIFAAAAERRAIRDALTASPPRALTMPVRERGTVAPRLSLLISLDPSKSRPDSPRWRVTRWEGDAPTGHVEAEDWAAAVRAADYAGGDLGAAKDAEVSGT